MEKLARRLGSPYLGAVVKGGCEGVRMMPEKANRKLFEALQALGREFGATGTPFDAERLRALAQPERFPRWMVPLMTLVLKTGVGNGYWNQQLKANGAYDRRFARPYLEEEAS